MSKDKDRAFFGHPAGLSTLFFTEMWERFSYYGMRAFLIIYMTADKSIGGLGLSKTGGGIVWGLFISTAYLLSLPGGWIADRFLGQRRAITVGGIGIMAGNALLAVPGTAMFYLGIVLIALGTGLFKPNVSTVVGQLYGKEDPRRDSGYTIFYMGINVGALGSPIVCGYLAQSTTFRAFLSSHGIDPNWCWHIAYLAVALGMAFGLAQYLLSYNRLGEAGMHPTIPDDPVKAARDRKVLGLILGSIALVVAVVVTIELTDVVPLTGEMLANIFGVGLIVATFAVFYGFYKSARDNDERRRITAMIPLFLGCIAFFGIFEQAGTTLTLFADHNVRKHWLGLEFVASYYQDVNPTFIILLAPLFAWLWVRLAKARKEPSAVFKFGIGMLMLSVSFVVMLPATAQINAGKLISPNYLIALYFFETCGELCLSPVGLSSMNKLAPSRMAGMVMGTWFLGTAAGEYLAGRATALSSSLGYTYLFYVLIIASLVVAAGLFAVAPAIKRMMGGATEAPAADLPGAMLVKDGDA